jgi:hypothetical protein
MKKSEALRKLKSHADGTQSVGVTSLYLFGSTLTSPRAKGFAH